MIYSALATSAIDLSASAAMSATLRSVISSICHICEEETLVTKLSHGISFATDPNIVLNEAK